MNSVESMGTRIDALDQQITEMAKHSIFKDVITGLMALRGVQLITTMTIIAELGDIKRFDSEAQLMAYLGLVPSEYSSGGSRHRGGITKTGNGHVRRVLIEAAWAYRHPTRKTRTIEAKKSHAPEEVREISWKAQVRLCGRYRSFEARGKNKLQACIAIARELSVFIWAMGQSYPSPIAP